MKTADDILQELLAIYDNWYLKYDSTEYVNAHPELKFPYVYDFSCSKEDEYYYIQLSYYADRDEYIATHTGVTYDDDRNECGGYAPTALKALEQLQSAIRERANKYLAFADKMEKDKK